MAEKIREKTFLPLEARVLRTLRRHGMLAPGERVLVAVSGGPDSVALLRCLHRLSPLLGIQLAAAHFNHMLRGAEADADEEFARRLCGELEIPFVCERRDVRAMAREAKRNLEETAREARYEFLRRAAADSGAPKIATGHHRNDQAETALFHFLRGSGLDGLAGIRPVVDGTVIRPLIECMREGIIEYLRDMGATWRVDASNSDLKLRRNRLRHECIPYLEKHFNPRLVATLARQAAQARETSALLDAIARAEYEKLRDATRRGVALPAGRLARLEPALRKLVLRHALREARGSLRGIAASHIDAVLRLCRPGASGRVAQLPDGLIAARRFGRLILLPGREGAPAAFFHRLPVPGLCRVPEAAVEIEARFEEPPVEEPAPPAGYTSAALDAEKVAGELVVRSRLPGDRYGGGKHRKVKKLLIGAKIDLDRRPTIPMVVLGDAVIWIPGFKPPRAFAAPPGAARRLVLSMRPI